VVRSSYAHFANPADFGESASCRAFTTRKIRCGIQNEPPAGGITACKDFGSRTEKATFYGTIVDDRQVWPAADRVAAWLHETALRLFPDSPYAKEHNTEAPKKPTKRGKNWRARSVSSAAYFCADGGGALPQTPRPR
jgi:hypothetical protein